MPTRRSDRDLDLVLARPTTHQVLEISPALASLSEASVSPVTLSWPAAGRLLACGSTCNGMSPGRQDPAYTKLPVSICVARLSLQLNAASVPSFASRSTICQINVIAGDLPPLTSPQSFRISVFGPTEHVEPAAQKVAESFGTTPVLEFLQTG